MTTKREPQCTTYAQLHEHMAHVYRMREGASVTVSSCVRKNGGPPTRWNDPTLWSDHPVFDGKPEEFEFALGIIERRPVFRYDSLYDQDGNKWITIGGFLGIEGGKLRLARDTSDQSESTILSVESLSWNPSRRTIKIGEIDAPKRLITESDDWLGERQHILKLYFERESDRDHARDLLIAALEGKKP